MTASVNRFVDWFVNRERQRRGFLKMIAREVPKQIMCVVAPENMGKTWLINRVQYECTSQKIPVVLVDFRFPSIWGPLDYLSLQRTARDQLNSPLFNDFTLATQRHLQLEVRLSGADTPSRVSVNVGTNSGEVTDSTVKIGDVAGGNIIKDSYLSVTADTDTMRRNIEAELIDSFFKCLIAFQQQQRTVFLLDSYETIIGDEADRWVQGGLLARIRTGQLPNVVLMVCSRRPPFADDWNDWLASTGLDNFQIEHVREYAVQKRGLSEADVQALFDESQGRPDLLGVAVENRRSSTTKAAEDDSWLY